MEASTGVYADEAYVRQRFSEAGLKRIRCFNRFGTQCSIAAKLLSQLQNFFTTPYNSRIQIEVLALQALLHDADGDKPAALTALENAILLAQPGGQIRPFLGLGSKMAHQAHRLADAKRALSQVFCIPDKVQIRTEVKRIDPQKSSSLNRRDVSAAGSTKTFVSAQPIRKTSKGFYRDWQS